MVSSISSGLDRLEVFCCIAVYGKGRHDTKYGIRGTRGESRISRRLAHSTQAPSPRDPVFQGLAARFSRAVVTPLSLRGR